MVTMTISVVIPARDSQNTIRLTVESLYNQTIRPTEVIVVVGEGDKTYLSIQDFILIGFVKIITTKPPIDYIRDAMWKRWLGIKESCGDMIFLTDSKIILEENALENAIISMKHYNVSVIAGITPAWPDQQKNFWAKLHDKALISNLPQFDEIGMLTVTNFGCTENLPVTALLFFTREVFDKVSDDFALNFSKIASTYDDYVLSWLIVKAGFPILVTNKVKGYHKHRTSWSEYAKQIARSGQSAAIMVKMYPNCPFGMRRFQQVRLITIVFSVILVFGIYCMFEEIAAVVGIVASLFIYLVLGIVNAIKAKEWKAFLFPLFTALLILNFTVHFTKSYNQPNRPEEVVKYLQIH